MYNDDGNLKVEEITYTFSYELQLYRIMDIVESGNNKNLEGYDFTPAEETPW